MARLNAVKVPDEHYLKLELENRTKTDPSLWSFLQKGSFDGVWYWDLENPDQEWISDEFWECFGVDPRTKEHSPSAWQDIIFKEDLDVAIDNFHKSCADPNHPYDQIVRYKHANGSTVWVRCRGIVMRDADGKPMRMLGAHNDITAVKRAEQAEMRERMRLEVANKELEAFVYGVSHDLKSPSRTALQLIEEGLRADVGDLNEDQRFLFEGACTTLQRMQMLIDDLLGYGRVVQQEMTWENVLLVPLVKDVVADLQSLRQDARVELDMPGEPRFCGFSSQIRMLVQNLVSNSLKYVREGVPAEVLIQTLDVPGKGTVLRVKDNGCGIPEEQVDRIFDAFTRLHRQEDVQGTGIGLALCRRVALNHNAKINVRSVVGEGTVFEISFPRGRI